MRSTIPFGIKGLCNVWKCNEVTIPFYKNNPFGEKGGIVILETNYLKLIARTNPSQFDRTCLGEWLGSTLFFRFERRTKVAVASGPRNSGECVVTTTWCFFEKTPSASKRILYAPG